MVRVLVIGLLALPLLSCGGAGGGVRSAQVRFGDPGEGNLGFSNGRTVVVRDDLLLFDLIQVLRHELMHVAGMDGHATETEPCMANGSIAYWPEEPCDSDLEIMARNVPPDPIRLIVEAPELLPPTQDAAQFWNSALGRTVFVVVAGF